MVFGLNLALVAALIVVGVTARSLAVFAEGGDYLLDAAGVAVAMFAVWLSARPPSPRRPQGGRDVTRAAALINAGWLLLLEVIVAVGAADRLIARLAYPACRSSSSAGSPPVVMTAGALILRGEDDDDADEEDFSVAAVLLDTVADAAAAAGVAIAGAIILATGGLFWLDPAVALTIAAVVSWHAVMLIRKVLIRRSPKAAQPPTAAHEPDKSTRTR